MTRIIIILWAIVCASAQAMNKSESFNKVHNQLNQSNSPEVSVIVELNESAIQNQSADQNLNRSQKMKSVMMKKLKRLGVREHKRFKHLPMMALELNENSLDELKNDPAVKKVYLNQLRKHLLRSSTKQVQAVQAQERGYSGEGQTVAIVDAGTSRYVDMLQGKVIEEACFTTQANIQGIQVYSNCSPNNTETRQGTGAAFANCRPCASGNNHGSTVAGVAVGNATQYAPIYKGVAIGANLIAVNVFSRVQNVSVCGNDPNFGTSCVVALDSDILAGLDHVFSLRNKHNIAAVNLSLGGGAFTNACDGQSAFTTVINKLHNAGIAVVAAAGNEASGVTISEPACISKAIAVGSVGDNNSVSDFTNSNAQIDFWAPGENITSSGGEYLNHYVTVNGTSFSAPHVSGAIAILKSYNNKLSIDEIKTILQTSGLQITDPLNGVSRPLIQINNALDIAPRELGIIPLLQLLLLND